MQILTAPGVRSSELAGTKDAPNAHALLAIDRQSGHAVLLARGLPPAPAGKGRIFTTDPGSNAVSEDQLPTNAANATVFAVTIEPQAGVPAPTGSIICSHRRACDAS